MHNKSQNSQNTFEKEKQTNHHHHQQKKNPTNTQTEGLRFPDFKARVIMINVIPA